MEAYAAGTRCLRPLYHAAISPEQPHRLTDEQRMEAVDALEKKLGLDGHARVVVIHEKEGREHLHVAWTRIDLNEMKAVPDSHNYRKHEECARDLERRFGHDRVQGAHAERDGVTRPERTPSRAELRQEDRTGIKGKDVRAEVTAAFRACDSGKAFKAALEEKGYILAAGNRRDFVIVDQRGGVHSLARRIEGVNADALRQYMGDVDRARLPNVTQAQQLQDLVHDDRRLDSSGAMDRPDGDQPNVKPGAEISPPELEGTHPASNDGMAASTALRVADKLTGVIGSLASFMADFLIGGSEKPRDYAADQAAQIRAQRRAAAALENIRDDLRQGRAIGVDDLMCLAASDLQKIKDKGDDYLRQLVANMESSRTRERDVGRERDR